MPCIQSLIADYKTAGGVCAGSINPGGYPESATPCVGGTSIQKGLCSTATEELLLKEECKNYVQNNRREVWRTIGWALILNMCTRETFNGFYAFRSEGSINRSSIQDDPLNDTDSRRLLPITHVSASLASGPISDLVNTRNRYSWICSLREKSGTKRHLCGVTLLSMPPSPTVLVSAAHCVTVCRSETLDKLLL